MAHSAQPINKSALAPQTLHRIPASVKRSNVPRPIGLRERPLPSLPASQVTGRTVSSGSARSLIDASEELNGLPQPLSPLKGKDPEPQTQQELGTQSTMSTPAWWASSSALSSPSPRNFTTPPNQQGVLTRSQRQLLATSPGNSTKTRISPLPQSCTESQCDTDSPATSLKLREASKVNDIRTNSTRIVSGDEPESSIAFELGWGTATDANETVNWVDYNRSQKRSASRCTGHVDFDCRGKIAKRATEAKPVDFPVVAGISPVDQYRQGAATQALSGAKALTPRCDNSHLSRRYLSEAKSQTKLQSRLARPVSVSASPTESIGTPALSQKIILASQNPPEDRFIQSPGCNRQASKGTFQRKGQHTSDAHDPRCTLPRSNPTSQTHAKAMVHNIRDLFSRGHTKLKTTSRTLYLDSDGAADGPKIMRTRPVNGVRSPEEPIRARSPNGQNESEILHHHNSLRPESSPVVERTSFIPIPVQRHMQTSDTFNSLRTLRHGTSASRASTKVGSQAQELREDGPIEYTSVTDAFFFQSIMDMTDYAMQLLEAARRQPAHSDQDKRDLVLKACAIVQSVRGLRATHISAIETARAAREASRMADEAASLRYTAFEVVKSLRQTLERGDLIGSMEQVPDTVSQPNAPANRGNYQDSGTNLYGK